MPWTRKQIKAIAASYTKRGKKIPPRIRKEMHEYWEEDLSSSEVKKINKK